MKKATRYVQSAELFVLFPGRVLLACNIPSVLRPIDKSWPFPALSPE